MLLHIALIERALSGVDKAAFDGDFVLQAAVVRFLGVIGEAASRVPEDWRALAPDVPWRQIVNMRNALVHGYAEVDLDIVWATVTLRLSKLKDDLGRLRGCIPSED